jgi:hypothetical protein
MPAGDVLECHYYPVVLLASRSAKRHAMSPAARAADLAMAEVDLPQLASAADGLENLARDFDVSQLPPLPAAVVTADRGSRSSLRRTHERVAVALGTPLLWRGAVHEVHLSHEREVLEVSRAVVPAVTGLGS